MKILEKGDEEMQITKSESHIFSEIHKSELAEAFVASYKVTIYKSVGIKNHHGNYCSSSAALLIANIQSGLFA